MMTNTDKVMQERIHSLLSSQPLAVLSTQRNGQPYSSLMAFAYTETSFILIEAVKEKHHLFFFCAFCAFLWLKNR